MQPKIGTQREDSNKEIIEKITSWNEVGIITIKQPHNLNLHPHITEPHLQAEYLQNIGKGHL